MINHRKLGLAALALASALVSTNVAMASNDTLVPGDVCYPAIESNTKYVTRGHTGTRIHSNAPTIEGIVRLRCPLGAQQMGTGKSVRVWVSLRGNPGMGAYCELSARDLYGNFLGQATTGNVTFSQVGQQRFASEDVGPFNSYFWFPAVDCIMEPGMTLQSILVREYNGER